MPRSTYNINNALEFKTFFDKFYKDRYLLEEILDPNELNYTVQTLRVKLCDALKYLADHIKTDDFRYLILKNELSVCISKGLVIIKRVSLKLTSKEISENKLLSSLEDSFKHSRFTHNMRKIYLDCLRVFNSPSKDLVVINGGLTQRDFKYIALKLNALKPHNIMVYYNKDLNRISIFTDTSHKVWKPISGEDLNIADKLKLKERFLESLKDVMKTSEETEPKKSSVVIIESEDSNVENDVIIIEE